MLGCVVQVVGVRSVAGVQWQDGRSEGGLPAPALVPAHDANEHELLPNDYVIEKSTAMPGVCARCCVLVLFLDAAAAALPVCCCCWR